MNELQIFNSPEFGDIRTITIDNEPWFCMIDICKALEISNPSQAKTRLNADGVITNEVIDGIGRKQNANFVNEPNMYKLIFQSKSGKAVSDPNRRRFAASSSTPTGVYRLGDK